MRLTVTDCCGIVTVTFIADEIARLTDIRAKNARLCGYRTPCNGPTLNRFLIKGIKLHSFMHWEINLATMRRVLMTKWSGKAWRDLREDK